MKALILIKGPRVLLTWVKLAHGSNDNRVLHPLAANDARSEEWR